MADNNAQNDPTVDLQTTEHNESGKDVSMGETTAFAADVDSPSTESDAGVRDILADDLRQSNRLGSSAEDDAEADFLDDFDGNLDTDLPDAPFQEIPMSNLDIEGMDDPVTRDILRSPDYDAPNVPGEIDIEGLDEDDLDLTDLPADARLDPLEE